jgi:hypothetical protein
MLVPNQESLDGTLTVVEALKSTPRLANQKPIRVVPVLSRTTPTLSRDGRFAVGVTRLVEFGERANLLVLPHDDELATNGDEQNANESSPLYKAYIELFQGLFPGSGPAGI